MNRSAFILLTVLPFIVLSGCTTKTSPAPQTTKQTKTTKQTSLDLRTVRLHFEGFTKSKSGAT